MAYNTTDGTLHGRYHDDVECVEHCRYLAHILGGKLTFDGVWTYGDSTGKAYGTWTIQGMHDLLIDLHHKRKSMWDYVQNEVREYAHRLDVCAKHPHVTPELRGKLSAIVDMMRSL